MTLHLMAIITNQGYIRKVKVILEVLIGADNIYLEVIPLKTTISQRSLSFLKGGRSLLQQITITKFGDLNLVTEIL